MRVFVAIILPDDVKDYLEKCQKEIDKSNVKMNLVAKKNLHLTLKFIGEVNNIQLSKITDRLERIRFNDFEIKLKGIGLFPELGDPRVVWAGVEPENEVLKLQKKIDSELLELHFDKKQEFSTHITLARIKFIKSGKLLRENVNSLNIESEKFSVRNFHLIKSVLTKDGPKYEIIRAFHLT